MIMANQDNREIFPRISSKWDSWANSFRVTYSRFHRDAVYTIHQADEIAFLQQLCQSAQFSTRRPGTCLKSFRFRVTTVARRAKQIEAISRSSRPIFFNFLF